MRRSLLRVLRGGEGFLRPLNIAPAEEQLGSFRKKKALRFCFGERSTLNETIPARPKKSNLDRRSSPQHRADAGEPALCVQVAGRVLSIADGRYAAKGCVRCADVGPCG
jgi:hypothetical protein